MGNSISWWQRFGHAADYYQGKQLNEFRLFREGENQIEFQVE